MRKQTWLAILVSIFGLIPGMIVGALLAYLYRVSVGWQIGYDPDWMMLRTLFGIEWPAHLTKWIAFVALPAGVHGGFAGAVAVLITAAVCKGAAIDTAAYATGTLITGLFMTFSAIAFAAGVLPESTAEATVQIVGLWFGLLSPLSNIPKPVPITGAT